MRVCNRVLFLFVSCVLIPGTLLHAGLKLQTAAATAGTDFIFTMVPVLDLTKDSNAGVVLDITSTDTCFVTVKINGKGYSKTQYVYPNVVTSMFIDANFALVFTSSTTAELPVETVYPEAAIHVVATKNITLSARYQTMTAGESILVMPTQVLGTDYIVASMPDMGWMYSLSTCPSVSTVCGVYDGTTVEYTVGGGSITSTSGGKKPGQKISFTLNRGDVWVVGNSAASKEGDMTGSVIHATKPVAVVSGNPCANVPTVERYSGYIAEMEVPMNSWAKHYQVPRFMERSNGYFMRIFAAETNTKISYNCSYWKTIQTVGGQEGRGYIYQRADGTGNKILSLEGDKAIHCTVYNPGSEDDNRSHVFQMALAPVEDYYTDVRFYARRAGDTSTNCQVGIIFPLTSLSDMPADLEFGSIVKGVFTWRTVKSVFGLHLAKDVFTCPVNGITYAFKECYLPVSGVYEVRCSQPFMCYVYGDDTNSSFGYPAGLFSTARVASGDSVAPEIQFNAENQQWYGSAKDMPEDSVRRSNLMNIFLQAGSSNIQLTTPPITGYNTRSMTWNARVIDATKDANATITASDWSGNSTNVSLSWSVLESGTLRLERIPNQIVCKGAHISLKPSLIGFQHYVWSTGDSTESISVECNDVGIQRYYLMAVTSTGKLRFSDTVTVTVLPNPAVPDITVRKDSLFTSYHSGVNFVWLYEGNQLISGSTINSIRSIGPGVYRVRVVDNATGCYAESNEISVGVADVVSDVDELFVRPNPVTQDLLIGSSRGLIHDVHIISATGEEIETSSRISSVQDELRIDLSDLGSGVYMLQCRVGQEFVRSSFVKF